MGEIAGASAVFAYGGALLDMHGSGPDGWQWSMIWIAAPLVLLTLPLLFLSEPARAGRGIEQPSTRAAVAGLWHYRAVIAPLLAGKIIVGLVVGAIVVWAAPAFLRTFGLAPGEAGALMSAVLLIGAIAGPLLGGFLADVCQRSGGPCRTMIAVSVLALLSTPASLFMLSPDIVWAFVLLVVLKTVFGAAAVMETTLATIMIPNELRGLCMSVLIAATVFFGMGAAPVVVSLMSGALGGPDMLGKALTLVCASAGIAAAGIFALGSRAFERRMQPLAKAAQTGVS
jgi:MFS family permease